MFSLRRWTVAEATRSHQNFPSDGRVLVIGITARALESRYGTKVCWMSPWEILGKTHLPQNVAAICISARTQQDHREKIRALAKKLSIDRVEVEESHVTLEERLKFWFGKDQEENRALTAPAEPTLELQAGEGEVRIPITSIRPLKDQPRKHFSRQRLKELMTSIRAIGQQTPIIVRKLEGEEKKPYELIDGERRVRACTLLGAKVMLAVVRTVANGEDQFVKSFVANFAREGHTPLETARSIQRILEFPHVAKMGKTRAVEYAASLAGRSNFWAYEYLKLLKLPEEVQRAIEPDEKDNLRLPIGVARFLCTIEDRDIQIKVCRESIARKLSANGARALARKLATEAGVAVGSSERSPREDYRNLRGCLKRAHEGAENFLDMPHRSLAELFEHRPLSDRMDTIAELDKIVELMFKIRDAIELKKGAPRE